MSDPSYGVKAFSIAGRMMLQRERLKGMTDAERQWRAQFVKDQELSPEEPKDVPEFYKATTNIIRRMYKNPMNALQKMFEPSLGYEGAYNLRHTIGKSLIALYAAWASYYVYRYYCNDWTKIKTIEVHITRPRIYPDDPNYPNVPKIEHYYDQGFYSSPLAQKK